MYVTAGLSHVGVLATGPRVKVSSTGRNSIAFTLSLVCGNRRPKMVSVTEGASLQTVVESTVLYPPGKVLQAEECSVVTSGFGKKECVRECDLLSVPDADAVPVGSDSDVLCVAVAVGSDSDTLAVPVGSERDSDDERLREVDPVRLNVPERLADTLKLFESVALNVLEALNVCDCVCDPVGKLNDIDALLLNDFVSDSLRDALCDSDNDALLEAVALAVPVGRDTENEWLFESECDADDVPVGNDSDSEPLAECDKDLLKLPECVALSVLL